MAELQELVARLDSEHQRALTRLGSVEARLTQHALAPHRGLWILLSGLLVLTGLLLYRSQHRRSGIRVLATLPATLRAEDAPPTRQAQRDGTTSPARQTVNSGPAAPPPRWPDADFGQADLNDPDAEHVLAEVDRLVSDGFPAAAALTLEQHLTGHEGKHPALLLQLLDIYRDMGQPWNEERVKAQLEALFNVDAQTGPANIPAPVEPPLHGPLMHLSRHREAFQRIQRTWSGAEADSALSSVLRRPSSLAPLALPAFREAVTLVSAKAPSAHSPTAVDGVPELSLTPLTTD